MVGTRFLSLTLAAIMAASPVTWADDGTFTLELRTRELVAPGIPFFASSWNDVKWDAKTTAIIVCDMWDSHHSVTAVRRVNEFAPRLNQVLQAARSEGATIIHSPSDCMGAYKEHPARMNALNVPTVESPPADVDQWCHRIPAEEVAQYPIDQSDGGEDEDAFENAQWAARLEAEGRKPGTPWLKQTPLLEIEPTDFIAAEGDVVWNVLQSRGIEHVILTGVHTNMCVLGRPFGLRQMVRLGMDTVLMRDCTDVMYNPKRWPFVSHFTGIDLVVNHIEQFVCPTITSDQILGTGEPFRFAHDKRPHLVTLIGEQEYQSIHSLPAYQANQGLGKSFRVSYVVAPDHEGQARDHFHGANHLKDADVVLISVRRRAMEAATMALLRKHIAAGKPVIGIRTASHAFAPKYEPPSGFEIWPKFDADVFGGNYSGHHGNKGKDAPDSFSWVVDSVDHAITEGIKGEWETQSWLYKTSPLRPGAQVLVMGRVEDQKPHEPVAWTYVRSDGGRSFYTSLGSPDDFVRDPKFRRLLANAIHWAAGLENPSHSPNDENDTRWKRFFDSYGYEMDGAGGKFIAVTQAETGWARLDFFIDLPAEAAEEHQCARTLLRVPSDLPAMDRTFVWDGGESAEVFLNGTPLEKTKANEWTISKDHLVQGDLNLIVLRATAKDWAREDVGAPLLKDDRSRSLAGSPGQWEFRTKALMDETDVTFTIPPQFGASTDQIQNWPR